MIKEEFDSSRIFLLHEFLSSDECAALIRRSEDLRYEVGTVGGVIAEGIRNNERVVIDDKPLADAFYQRAAPWLPPEVEGRRLVRFNERWRFYRYRPGQTFRPHRDGAYTSFHIYEQSAVTFMIYLNQEMRGGETRFFVDAEHAVQGQAYVSVKPTTGSALVFLHSIWHEGAAVLSGEKYVLRTDVMYNL